MAGENGNGGANGNGRNGAGQFAKGNRGGPGNPYLTRQHELRTAMMNAVTAKDMESAFRKLVELAHEGDVQAMKLLFAYTVGRAPDFEVDVAPRASLDPTRLTPDELVAFLRYREKMATS